MLKLIKKTALVLFSSLALILVLLFFKPHLILNKVSLTLARNILKRDKIELSWRTFQSHGSVISLFERKNSYRVEDLCLNSENPQFQFINGCLSELRIAFSIEFKNSQFKFTELGPLTIHGDNLKIKIAGSSKTKETSKLDFLTQLFPETLENLRLHSLDIDLKNTALSISDNPPIMVSVNLNSNDNAVPYDLTGNVSLRSPEIGQMLASISGRLFENNGKAHQIQIASKPFCVNWTNPRIKGCLKHFTMGLKLQRNQSGFQIAELAPVNIELDKAVFESGSSLFQGRLLVKGPLDERGRLKIRGQFNESASKLRTKLDLAGVLKRGGIIRLTGPIHLTDDSDLTITSVADLDIIDLKNIQYYLPIELQASDFKAEGKLRGKLGVKSTYGTVNGFINNKVGKVNLLNSCRYAFIFDKRNLLDCPIEIASKQSWPLKDSSELPTRLKGHLVISFKSPFPPSPSDPWTGDAKLDFEPFKSNILIFSGAISAVFHNYVLDKDPRKNIEVSNDITFKVIDFRRLNDLLYKTQFAIPAPFNAMNGEIYFESRGKYILEKNKIPFFLKTDLISPEQYFKTEITGQFGVFDSKKDVVPHFTLNALLSQVQLVLPRLGLEKPPRVTPDPRIGSKSIVVTSQSKELAFFYEVSVTTPPDQPLKLLSDLAKEPIPIGVNLSLKSHMAPHGEISIREFPLQLFRRNAVIKYLNFNLTEKRMDNDPVNGELLISYADYKIHVLLSGTVKHPHLKFESVPYLREDQAIAVMLFGKLPEDLGSDQNSSAVGMQAALADRALALSSLYYLASTPIESIGYNGQEKMFTAKFKIQEGISLDIGADSERLKQVGINKRLKHSWYIHTYVSNPKAKDEQSVTTLLEKYFRY